MTDRVIPISDAHRVKPLPVRGNSAERSTRGSTRAAAPADLRISVTDRCNFRCVYCMPREVFGSDYKFLARDQLLSFEEIVRLARIFKGHGVEKIRLTGGEPRCARTSST